VLRRGSELLRSGPELCGSVVCGSYGRSRLLRSGRCADLLRSRRCADLRGPGGPELLRSGCRSLLQHRLRLQDEEALVPRLVRPVQEEEPLLRSVELLQRRADLRRPHGADLRGPDGSDLRGSGRGLLPLNRMFEPASVLTARLHPVGLTDPGT
jgi:hypothetical protein